jgi:hypothetical protein
MRRFFFQEWKRTGYFWEQYDAQNGEGRRRSVEFCCSLVVPHADQSRLSMAVTRSRAGPRS